jgi:hypothetical protein
VCGSAEEGPLRCPVESGVCDPLPYLAVVSRFAPSPKLFDFLENDFQKKHNFFFGQKLYLCYYAVHRPVFRVKIEKCTGT